MRQSEKESRPSLPSNVALPAISLAGQIGCVVPLIILAAVLGGRWLDRQLGTGHWFTLGLLLASLPLSMLLIFRMALRVAQDMNEAWRASVEKTKDSTKSVLMEDEDNEQ